MALVEKMPHLDDMSFDAVSAAAAAAADTDHLEESHRDAEWTIAEAALSAWTQSCSPSGCV